MVKQFPDTRQGWKDAEAWKAEQEQAIDLTGAPLTLDDLKLIVEHRKANDKKEENPPLVEDIVNKYLAEVTPTKGCRVSETTVLKKFLRESGLAKRRLSELTKTDAYDYRNKRLKEIWRGKPISPSAVRREVNSIQRVFEVAKEEWGYTDLSNPFRALKIQGGEGISRERVLRPGEMERLEKACEKCRGNNKSYVPLAIYLAFETGMRLQEIFNLTWQDIDLDSRRIEIRKSKTDWKSRKKGRTIVMSVRAMAQFMIEFMAITKVGTGSFPNPNDRIFPMSKDAFKQAWGDVLDRAGITDLTFHDLRHEAGKSRPRKSAQDDKWNFCLTTAIVAVNRRNHEQTTPPEPLTGL
jgi:integrase